MGNPVIDAVAAGLFRFTSLHQVRARLTQIREEFLISKDQDLKNPDTIKLWIRDYALTPEEISGGYLGNYALIRPKNDGKHISLIAEKLNVDLKSHPRKQRPKMRHPDWGHPILRAVLKKKLYLAVEEVHAEFMRLHEEFPEVSIPGPDRLHIIVYQGGKEQKVGSPVQKITLRIRTHDDGQYYMTYSINSKKRPSDVRAKPETPKVSRGYFTSMVSLKKKKKPTAKPAASGTSSNSTH